MSTTKIQIIKLNIHDVITNECVGGIIFLKTTRVRLNTIEGLNLFNLIIYLNHNLTFNDNFLSFFNHRMII